MIKRWILIASIIVAIARPISISQVLLSNSKIQDETNGGPTATNERPFCCDHPVIKYFNNLSRLNRPCFDVLDKDGKPIYHVFYVRFNICPFSNSVCKFRTLPMIVEANTSSKVAANLWCPLQDDKQYPRILYTSDIINGTFNNKAMPLFYGIFWNPIHNISSIFSACAFSTEDVGKIFATNEVLTFRDDSVWEKSFKSELVKENKIGILAKNLTSIGNVATLEKNVKNSEQITSFAVRNRVISMKGTFYDILYFGTAIGQFLKGVAFQDNNHPSAHWSSVHKIDQLVINNTFEPVKLIAYMGNHIQEIPLANCEKHRTCESCVEAQDPDCVWNMQFSKCEFFQFNVTHDFTEDLVQDVEHGGSKICALGTTRPPEIISTLTSTKSQEKECTAEMSEMILQIKKLHDSVDSVMNWLVPIACMIIFFMLLNLLYCVFVCNWGKIYKAWKNLTRENPVSNGNNMNSSTPLIR